MNRSLCFSTRLKLLAAAALMSAGAGLTAAPAMAAPSACDAVSGNLITNCGFETGDLTGWTVTGNTGYTGVTTGTDFAYSPHSGSFYAFQGAVGSENFLGQTFADSAGATYAISLWMNSDGTTPNEYDVEWNGTTLLDQTNIPNTDGWTELTFLATGTGSDTLSISSRDDPAYLATDDVVVVAAVPEPAALALMSVGLAFAGFAARRRLS